MKRIPKKFVRKPLKQKAQSYKVMWSYEDFVGYDSGVVDIIALNKKEAEEKFYKENKPLYINRKDKKVASNQSGFVCESVLTYEEWKNEGSPKHL